MWYHCISSLCRENEEITWETKKAKKSTNVADIISEPQFSILMNITASPGFSVLDETSLLFF